MLPNECSASLQIIHMPTYRHPAPSTLARDLRIAVAMSTYHETVTGPLGEGATEAFMNAGGQPDNLTIMPCPGAWELPVAVAAMHQLFRTKPDAYLVLGCVIRGDTTHDQWINSAVCGALADFSVRIATPVGLGLLTCNTMEQAMARAGGERGNKGYESMSAVIEQVASIAKFASVVPS
jgi:6,7-dimethyl-8-ribityllumazine synthase